MEMFQVHQVDPSSMGINVPNSFSDPTLPSYYVLLFHPKAYSPIDNMESGLQRFGRNGPFVFPPIHPLRKFHLPDQTNCCAEGMVDSANVTKQFLPANIHGAHPLNLRQVNFYLFKEIVTSISKAMVYNICAARICGPP
jgi:hypothetical protein